MKKILALLLALVMVFSLAACVQSDPQNGTQGTTNGNGDQSADLSGTYDITMWVSEKEGVAELFQSQIDAFEAANPGIVINASIEGVTEADAGSQVIADVASAPDIYCFAQDQLVRLVQAAALAAPGKGAQATVTEANDAGSVAAASVAGTIYAYPLTSDNGFFMYYDTSVISDEQVEDLAAIVAACESSNLKFRYALENAWYNAGFFFAAGCHSSWTVDAAGEYTSVDDDFNSDAGLIAMKGMQILAKSPCYESNADIFTDAAVVISGTWAAADAAAHFGENLGVTDLPSFTVDGNTYHLGSYSGYKLMGVKPQADAKKAAVLSKLAQYLTNEECQLARFNKFGWGPSNVAAQANEAVAADATLVALAQQNVYAVPQGQIHGSWWDIAKVLGADAKAATSDAELQTALTTYENAINGLLSMSDEEKLAWSVIGALCNTNWDTDFPMTKTAENTYTSEALELKVGNEFKVRQGASWDVNFGADGVAGGANIVVEADGTYQIQLVYDGTTATITLIPVE